MKKIIFLKNRKVIILSAVAMSMALALTSCDTKSTKSDNNEEIAVQSEISVNEIEQDKSSEDKTTENKVESNSNSTSQNSTTNQNKQETNTNSNTNTNASGNTSGNTSNSGNTNAGNQVLEGLTSLTYTSNNLGITFNVPESWKGKYNVIEEDGKVSVYMKHKDNSNGIGLLFIIKKQGVDENEVLNSIDGIESVDVNGQTFVVGGPTGYCMEDGDSLIPTYNVMVGECIYPVSSIKAK